jgi:hypothetical protein
MVRLTGEGATGDGCTWALTVAKHCECNKRGTSRHRSEHDAPPYISRQVRCVLSRRLPGVEPLYF